MNLSRLIGYQLAMVRHCMAVPPSHYYNEVNHQYALISSAWASRIIWIVISTTKVATSIIIGDF